MARHALHWIVALWAVLASGCTLDWDRVWNDGGKPVDGQAHDQPAPDRGAGLDQKPPHKDLTKLDKKLSTPDSKLDLPPAGPCQGKLAGTVCRPSKGVCDLAETCTGKSDKCPANALHPKSKECRPSSGTCDPPETCTGKNHSCPADVVWVKKQQTFSTTPGTDGHIVKESSTKFSLVTKQVQAFCDKDGSNWDLARGFLSFDTNALPSLAKVTGATLTGCFMGGKNSGAALIELYSATFGLPVTGSAYNAPVTKLNTKLPKKNGPNTFSVPVSAVQPSSLTQFLLWWPITDCPDYSGQIWSGASNTMAMGQCTVTPNPWKLAVSYCGP